MVLLHLGLALWLWLPAASAEDDNAGADGWLAATFEGSLSGSAGAQEAGSKPAASKPGQAQAASAALVPATLLLEVPASMAAADAVLPPPSAPPESSGPPSLTTTDTAQRSYYEIVQRKLAAAASRLPATNSGEARLRFTVLADGAVTAVQLLSSSGDAGLDAAALQLPQQAAPLPLPPQSPLTLEVPVRAEP